MKEIPILFSTEMVQAILEGRKTMTRRIVKPQIRNGVTLQFHPDGYCLQRSDITGFFDTNHIKCKYGQPGDVFWVRETWCLTQPKDPETYYFGYKCGIQPYSSFAASEKFDFSSPDKWHPSIHMPKEAARIWLQVEEIRVERLQDITEEDAIAEGVEKVGDRFKNYYQPGKTVKQVVGFLQAKISFKSLWNEINGEESWDSNPWVWVVKFKVLSTTGKPIIITQEQFEQLDSAEQQLMILHFSPDWDKLLTDKSKTEPG